MNSRRIGLILAVLLSAAALSTACNSVPTAQGTQSQAVRMTIDLPSSGWAVGIGEQAILSGPFHASITGNKACAWIGSVEMPTLWPPGYKVRTNPLQLIGPNGEVVANEGDTIESGGGGVGPAPSCGAGSAWSVQNPINRTAHRQPLS
jgi:predicted small secreted protein